MMQHKQIDWSYQWSPNAVLLGFEITGCWTVSVADAPAYFGKPVSGHATEAEAVEAARKLPMPFGRMWRKYETF